MAMERGYFGVDLIRAEDKSIGIDLGFYGYAEHEWGIDGIQKAFGIPIEDERGFEAQRITRIPNELYSGKYHNDHYCIYKPGIGFTFEYGSGELKCIPRKEDDKKMRLLDVLDYSLRLSDSSEGIATAWDDSTFGIRVRGSRNIEMIEQIEDAFLTNDVVIDTRSGLVKRLGLLVYSQIPEHIKKDFRESCVCPRSD